jgi:hypothetical protein
MYVRIVDDVIGNDIQDRKVLQPCLVVLNGSHRMKFCQGHLPLIIFISILTRDRNDCGCAVTYILEPGS